MQSDEAAGSAREVSKPGRAFYRVFDGALLRACEYLLRNAPSGRLHLTLPSGRSAIVGAGGRGVQASIVMNNYGIVRKAMRRGLVGFAEAYMAGDFDTDSLYNLCAFYCDNEAALVRKSSSLFQRSRLADRWLHRRRANTHAGSRRNISAHYDLGNDFYRLWLDAEMTYSSGVYARPDMPLEAAQELKYLRILAALDLQPSHRVLEIGCGWGGFARRAAARCAHVTGITISQKQFEEAGARMAVPGLADKVDIRFEDYRDTQGQFDRIASIEMIEAVGEENWPAYFKTIAARLAPGGLAVVQAITIPPAIYEIYRRNPDFIQCYIFPGGMLPTIEAMRARADEAGLVFEEIGAFAGSYARTLAEWRNRFEENWPRISALGLDERFRRMWNYYLTYCETGFERGLIDVGLYRLRKPA